MTANFKEIELKLVSPTFDSRLLDSIMELNYLRRSQLQGTNISLSVFPVEKDIPLIGKCRFCKN